MGAGSRRMVARIKQDGHDGDYHVSFHSAHIARVTKGTEKHAELGRLIADIEQTALPSEQKLAFDKNKAEMEAAQVAFDQAQLRLERAMNAYARSCQGKVVRK